MSTIITFPHGVYWQTSSKIYRWLARAVCIYHRDDRDLHTALEDGDLYQTLMLDKMEPEKALGIAHAIKIVATKIVAGEIAPELPRLFDESHRPQLNLLLEKLILLIEQQEIDWRSQRGEASMSNRKSINLKGFGHTNPIPVACRLGNLVMSGSILPRDREGKIPETLDEQCVLMFRYVKEVMTTAGGTTDDIIKVNVGMRDSSNREILNKHWVAMFPDAEARPARHTEKKDLPPGILIACEITAVLEQS